MNFLYDYSGRKIGSIEVVNPELFGAIGDGVANDRNAIQSAVNKRGLIQFAPGKTYRSDAVIKLLNDTILDLNGSTIVFPGKYAFFNFITGDTFTEYNGNGNITIKNGTIVGGVISFAHGENIKLENVTFKDCLNNHFLEIAGCKNYVIEGCRFVGMKDSQSSVCEYVNVDPCTYAAFPWNTSGLAFYDGAKNDGILVNNCIFALGSGDYAYGFNAFGVHGVDGQSVKHKNITLKNNTVIGFTGCGFRVNDMENVTIMNNNIQVEGDGIRIGDVGAASDILVQGNYIVSNNGQKIALTSGQYTGITIVKNATYGTIEEF